MPAIFTVDSYFNKEAQFKKVIFGADAKITEAELNEAQDIQNFRTARLLQLVFGSRPLYMGTYAVANGKLNITNEYVSIDGEIILLTSTDFAVASGDAVYLNKIESVKAHTDGIKKHGDLATSTTVPNTMLDARMGEETTRRLQVTYQLTKTNVGTGTFQKLCDIVAVGGQPTVQKLTFTDTTILADARAIATALSSTAETNAINFAKGFGLGSVAKDIGSTDLNTLDVTGFYQGTNLTNSPRGILADYYGIIHIKTSATGGVQIAIGTNPEGTYSRKKSNSTWTAWESLVTQTTLNAHANTFTLHTPYVVSAGTGTAYTATLTPAPTLVKGLSLRLEIHADNTGSATVNVNGLGAKTIKKGNGGLLSAGNLKTGSVYTLVYNGTDFILQGEGGSGNAQPAEVLSGKTFSNDTGDQTGSMTNKTGVVNEDTTWINTNTDTSVSVHVPKGYYPGGEPNIQITDADLVTANIKAGVNIFGVAGDTNVVNTSVSTNPASAGQIRSGQKAYVNGALVTGTLAVQATTAQTITPGTANIVKGAGVYDGAITIEGDPDLVPGNIKAGVNIFGVAGTSTVSDTSEALNPAGASHILAPKVAFVNGAKVTGTMATSTTSITPGTANQTIPAGYHDGTGTVAGDADLLTGNIRAGVDIFGVAGKTEVVDTSEATSPAITGHIVNNKVAFVNGVKLIGDMPNRGAGGTVTPGTANQTKGYGYYSTDITIAGDADLVSANIKAGADIFGVAGKTEVVDTTEVPSPITVGRVLAGRVGFVNGAKITGTMPDRGAWGATPGTANITIPDGYHSGAGVISGDADLISANIKAGVNIFGVAGKTEVVDTSEATVGNRVTAGDMLTGKVGFVQGAKVTGTMANNGAGGTVTPSTANQTKPAGYYSSAITISGDADLISANIKAGVDIFGVVGATNVVDTSDATKPIDVQDLREGYVGFVNGVKKVGTMPDYALVGTKKTFTPGATDITIPYGYYGLGNPSVIVGDADLISANIKAGVDIFGVAGKTEVVDTAEATVANRITAGDVLSGKVGFVQGAKVTGTMANNGAGGTVTPGTANQTKPAGYYSSAITISGDTDLVSANIKAGVDIFGVVGATNVVDTSEATSPASAGQILTGKIGFVNGAKVTGTMPNQGSPSFTPGIGSIPLSAGYYSGGSIAGDPDLISANIKAGVDIFGVAGKSQVVDTTEGTSPATNSQILTGRIAWVNGTKTTGTMPNQGSPSFTPGASAISIPAGYYSGGSVAGDTDLVSANIKAGVNIFGVAGATNVIDTTEATAPASASQILTGRKAFVNGAVVSGTIANNGAGGTVTPSASNQTKPAGYYSSAITIAGDADLKAFNILKGVNIFGVTGTVGRKASGAFYFINPDTVQTVNNLAFEPAVVLLMGFTTGSSLLFRRTIVGSWYKNSDAGQIAREDAMNCYDWYHNGGNVYTSYGTASTTSTGFTFSSYQAGQVVTWEWYAYEGSL
jgi:hypothetical protein